MQPEPKSLRFWEQENKRKAELKAKGTYKPAPLEHIDFHDRCDHGHYRHAPWAARTHFWIYLATFGKGGFFLFIFLGIWVALFETFRADRNHFQAFFEAFSSLFYTVSLPCLLVWGLASLVIHKFPRLWAKPGKGPKWELNRRTGMITVERYCGQYSCPVRLFETAWIPACARMTVYGVAVSFPVGAGRAARLDCERLSCIPQIAPSDSVGSLC